jgi:hypothetical protein
MKAAWAIDAWLTSEPVIKSGQINIVIEAMAAIEMVATDQGLALT